MDYIRAIERQQIREDIPQVRVADNVKVHYRIKEGDRERIQVFQGDVIRMASNTVSLKSDQVPARPSPSARCPSVSVLSVPSRFTAPRSPSSRSFVTVASVAPSCTTSATRWARLLASPRSAKKIAASVHSFGRKGHLRVALLFI